MKKEDLIKLLTIAHTECFDLDDHVEVTISAILAFLTASKDATAQEIIKKIKTEK